MAVRGKMCNIYFDKLIQDGEKKGVAGGFVAQTANGTAKWKGTGWNNTDASYTSAELPPSATRPSGRSNRTGE